MTNAFLFVSRQNNSHFFHISFRCDRQTVSAHIIIVLCVAIFFLSRTHIEMPLISIILYFIQTMLSHRRKSKQIEKNKKYAGNDWQKSKQTWKPIFEVTKTWRTENGAMHLH